MICSLMDCKVLVRHFALVGAASLFAEIFIHATQDIRIAFQGIPILILHLSVRVLVIVQFGGQLEEAGGVVELGGADLVWIIETKL